MVNLLKPLILKVKDIAYKQNLIADYVVEQGTSGIWVYRKWNSGIAEVWLIKPQSLSNCPLNGALMGGYYAQWNNPPFGNFPVTFTDYPIAKGQGALGNGAGFVMADATLTYINTIICIGNQSSIDMNRISIDIKGRWK